MSETFILLGKGIPSIVQRNYSLPGTRLTASEAREYARDLLALADELDPADPPASGDDFGDIRWRAAELEQAKPVGYQSTYERHYAADTRRLLDALDKARRERGAAVTALEPFAAIGDILANSTTIHPDYSRDDREIYSLNDAVLTRRDFVRAYKAARGVI